MERGKDVEDVGLTMKRMMNIRLFKFVIKHIFSNLLNYSRPLVSIKVIESIINVFLLFQSPEDKLNDEMQLFENFFAKQPHETIK